MKLIKFVIDLSLRFVTALMRFTLGGWIGWLGILLILLKVTDIIRWSWWLALLPLEYGVAYCAYMTVDGALYRAGVKGAGRYVRFTQGVE